MPTLFLNLLLVTLVTVAAVARVLWCTQIFAAINTTLVLCKSDQDHIHTIPACMV